MKKNVIAVMALFFFLLTHSLCAVPQIEFKTSKTLGLWKFAQSLTNGRMTSAIIHELYQKSRHATPEMKAELDVFSKIREEHFSHVIQFTGYPKARNEMSWDLYQCYELQAALAKDIDDFQGRTTQTLPPADHRNLFSILRKLEPLYDELIWSPSQKALVEYVKNLENVAKKARFGEFFEKSLRFYQGVWPDSVPITVVLHPIPEGKGDIFAHMMGNIAVLDASLGEKDFSGQYGILFHEVCHSIFESQNVELQMALDSVFEKNSSFFSDCARKLFNEVLATTIGNGIVFKSLAGKLNEAEWYHDVEIDAMARALYPLVESCFNKQKKMDEEFVETYIQAYTKAFPDAPRLLEKILPGATLLNDCKILKGSEIVPIFSGKWKKKINVSGPINYPETLKEIKTGSPFIPTLVAFSDTQRKQVEDLLQVFPPLKKKPDLEKAGVWLFFGVASDNRMILIFKITSKKDLEELVQKLAEMKILPMEPGYLIQ